MTWLEAVPATTRSLLIDLAPRLDVEVGAALEAAAVYVVSGSVRVLTHASDGDELTVERLGPSDTWLELSGCLLRASETSEVILLDSRTLEALALRHRRLRPVLARTLASQSAAAAAVRARHEPPAPSKRSLPRRPPPAPASPEAVPEAEPAEHYELGHSPRRWRGRAPVVLQLDQMDCGAAVLASTARALGVPVTLAKARDAVGTGVEGTSLVGLVRGAESLGIEARMVKTSEDRLEDLPLPAILHINGTHWVVVDRVTTDAVRVMDPGSGRHRLPRAALAETWTGFAAVFDGQITPAVQASGALDPLRWIREHLRPQRNRLLLGVLLAFATAGLQMVTPAFSGYVVDKVILPKRLDHLPLVIAVMAGTVVASSLIGVVQRALLSWAAIQVDGSALDSLTGRLLALPMSYFATRRVGDVQRRLAGLTEIRSIAVAAGVSALAALTQLVAALVLMVLYSPFLTAAYLVTLPLYVFVLRRASRRLRPMFEGLEEAWGHYGSRQIDALRSIETVKALGAETAIRTSLSGQFVGLRKRMFSTDLTVMGYDSVIQLLSLLSTVAMLTIGAREVVDGHLSLGGLVAFNALVALASGPISAGLALFDQLQLVRTLFDRVSDVLEAEPEQLGVIADPPRLKGRIDIRGLTFSFPGPTATPVLQDIRLSVQPGSLVAIVGRSGSGKSTLARCLAGLLPTEPGVLFVDGIDVTALGAINLRAQVGVVLPQCEVFDGTVRDNIAFGKTDLDDADIGWAAATAGLGDAHLRDGLDTMLGENGVQLSAGQLQRLALARAVITRPPILVLDEPTAHLDGESRRWVRDGIAQVARDRTTFLITHDPKEARDADVVLVLDEGRISERGTHDELMRRRGLYRHLQSMT